ncbi:hypothetical protein JEQ12_011472 [Ovis aries]|uniref:Gastric triacylglycerol lipase n=2 Tax=Ovis aries TaxID=9940 RepID=A0A836CUC7_SHEEP|nr:hypothetical protein JEQ12_011472 [Ovis aries]
MHGRYRLKMRWLLVTVCFIHMSGNAFCFLGRIAENPEASMNVSQMISFWGYPSEMHKVITADGYILQVYRIPHGKNDANHLGQRPVVFLQHGLLASATNWISNLPNNSLGFLLADAGYDVWLGNSRGNTWAREHLYYSPDSPEFWAFSFDEMAEYDLPSTIDFILKRTGQKKLHYVGHSQGTTIGFVAFSTNPTLAEKIEVFHALAPVATVKYTQSLFNKLALIPHFLFKIIFGNKMFYPHNFFEQFLGVEVCSRETLDVLCKNALFAITGADNKNFNMSRLDVYIAHNPAGTSVQNILHWTQAIKSGKFQAFDWGASVENLMHYNQSQIISYWGYPYETYDVVTEDGYILGIYRIPHGRGCPKTAPKPVVYLQHGLVASASNWICNLPNNSLAFLLADVGYDVWLGNSRGNTFSRKHLKFSPKSPEYWAFSLDEMANYDLPATINFIIEKTRQEQLYYVGHSQGTTIARDLDNANSILHQTFESVIIHIHKWLNLEILSNAFIAFSTNPELAKRIKIFFALAPVTTVKYTQSPMKKLTNLSRKAVKVLFGDKMFSPHTFFDQFIATKVCNRKIFRRICSNFIFTLSGFDPKNLNTSRLDVYFAQSSAGTSVQTMLHWAQAVNSGRFQAFDWGNPDQNMKHFHQEPKGIPTMWLFLTTAYLICGTLNAAGFFNLEKEPNPEVWMSTSEIITYNGYPSEEYEVTTQDGYILSVNRIPHGRKDTKITGARPVVYLQHALFSDNASWLENFANGSLGFLLADAGYDVWMGNSRGNTWSRRHKTLSVKEEKFWAFSFHEMAKYDLPGIIDFIVNKTGQQKLYFVGYSLGTTIGFVAFATMPELAQRIKMNFALGPVVSFKYPTGIFTRFFQLPSSAIKKLFGTKGFFSEESIGKSPSIKICNNKILWVMCSEFLSLWAGFNKKNMNMSRMDVYMSHAPTGSSIQNILHIKQLYHSDEFRAYDWGSEAENMRHYNQSRPPLYDLTAMKVPTAIWAGGNDILITPRDVARILPQIRNLRYFKLLPDWNHFDFIWGLDAAQRVYSKIIDLMKSYP